MHSLTEKIGFLSRSDSYPDAPDRVEVIETHMSFIFLAGSEAYKLKKPVKYPFLDFTTLAARKIDCEEELRLNKRLAAETYLGLCALTREPDGQWRLNGDGTPIEWLVHMKRLHRPLLMDRLIETGKVSAPQLKALGRILGRFYALTASTSYELGTYVDHLKTAQDLSRTILTKPRFGLATPAINAILDRIEALQAEAFDMIAERAEAGYLCEGHGDLRPEHIWLGEPAQVIDALEFNRGMRILDPFDEVNYLGIECAMLGCDWARPLLLEALAESLPVAPAKLMAFYGAFRCVLRARICIAHLLDPAPSTPEKWTFMAKAYLARAARELATIENHS